MANTAATTGQPVDMGGQFHGVSFLGVGYGQPGQMAIQMPNASSGSNVTSGYSTGTAIIMSGSGAPGSLVAPPGSLYLRTDQAAQSSGLSTNRCYVNYTGSAWVAFTSATS